MATEVEGDFEEMTHYYLRRVDNYEVFTTEEKVTSLIKLLNSVGDVPKDDPEELNLTKLMEVSEIARALTDEYF